MPRRDGTGNSGIGRGQGFSPGSGQGRGAANTPLGSDVCTCPKCGHQEPHNRGIPCVDIKCPKCDTQMTGEFCK